ncbi:hypothetical protein HII36_13265 [Nonomuraea sp. NN258]|uniref:hypothetical protein n=1 Tax=Nonomuraea antri TaxID=2730852 RepID=UPI00156A53C9|nr:hypothetical protein [Nonomuraea antri]NRQ32802.1 hypothetical protein [Nonomuraea antri]
MKIRSLPAAALLATALGAAVLAGAVPAAGAATVPAGAHALSPLPPDWYWSSHYATLADCRAAFTDEAQNGQYTGLAPCRWYNGDRYRPAGYYFLYYIP